MNNKNMKRIQAVVISAGVVLMCVMSSPLTGVRQVGKYLLAQTGLYQEKELPKSFETVDGTYTDNFCGKNAMLELNGLAAKKMGMRGLYSDMKMYIADGDYIVSVADDVTPDYDYDQLTRLYEFLKEHDVNLLYVNEPTKYVDDDIFVQQFGIQSFSNRTADKFLQRISEAGVPTLDLRQKLAEEQMDIQTMFYRTDHHWTTTTALWAAKQMVEGLNQYYDYDIDTSIYDPDQYEYTVYPNSWLGEQGRKIGKSYVGLDDFTKITPKFDTSYVFKDNKKDKEGTFDKFISEKVLNSGKSVYDEKSWHYAYNQKNVINKKQQEHKVLVVGDSYEQTSEPFLSLAFAETDSVVLRNFKKNLYDYILENEYDTVIICYAQFMIGAHENPSSANHRMFAFDTVL